MGVFVVDDLALGLYGANTLDILHMARLYQVEHPHLQMQKQFCSFRMFGGILPR